MADKEKKQLNDIPSDSLLRKRQSINDSILTCFYLYYILIALDPSITIILNSNSTHGCKPLHYIRNFSCHSIFCNNLPLFKYGLFYKIIFDSNKEMNTVLFDEILNVPIIDSNQNTKYYSDKSCRFIHHILIHRINSLLHSIGQEIHFHSRKSKQNSLSKILLNSFVDINQNDEFIQINKPTISRMNDDSFEHQRYRELCEILKEVFSYFLDNKTGKTKQLIIT